MKYLCKKQAAFILMWTVFCYIILFGAPEVYAQAPTEIQFLDENGTTQICNNYKAVTQNMATLGSQGTTTWYAVESDTIINDRIMILGDVHLILSDNTTLDAKRGISVIDNNRFTVYAQSDDGNMGRLIATGHYANAVNHYHSAGIGGDSQDNVGTITINGGNITAIGGGYAAGIGGGYYGSAGGNRQNGYGGGDITISGGVITATNENRTSGIGAGKSNLPGFAFAGVQSTFSTGTNGRAVIRTTAFVLDQKDTQNWSGIIFEHNNGNVFGQVSLTQNLTIESYEKLDIAGNSVLSIPGSITVTNNGTINIKDNGLINGDGTLDTKNGSLNGDNISQITINCKVDTSASTHITFTIGSDISNKQDLSILLTAAANYELPQTITVRIQGQELNAGKYTYDSAVGKLVIPANEILGNIEIIASADRITIIEIPAKEATCEEDGNIAYYKDIDTDKCYTDSTKTTEIAPEDTVIKAKGHSWGEWVITKQPSIDEEGQRERVCKNDPAYKEMEAIAKLTSKDAIFKQALKLGSPNTGDTIAILIWAAFIAVSCLGLFGAVRYVRRRRK